MRLLFWVAVVVIAAALALFAMSNRETVGLSLWPLPFVVELRLYLAILAALLVGFVLGAAATWVAGRSRRRESRRRGRRLAVLERELEATRSQLPARG